jgi:hypothetical protein
MQDYQNDQLVILEKIENFQRSLQNEMQRCFIKLEELKTENKNKTEN